MPERLDKVRLIKGVQIPTELITTCESDKDMETMLCVLTFIFR